MPYDISTHTRRALLKAGSSVAIAGLLSPGLASAQGDRPTSSDGVTNPESADLVKQAIRLGSDLTDIQGIRTRTVERNGTTQSMTERFWERPPTHVRTEIIEVPDAGTPGDVSVSNGSVSWQYNSEHHRVTRTEHDEDEVRANIKERQAEIENRLDQYDYTCLGSETVAGRETRVIEIVPTTDTPSVSPIPVFFHRRILFGLESPAESAIHLDAQTIWIDVERTYPVKQRIVGSTKPDEVPVETTGDQEELTVETTISHDEIIFNQEVTDKRFEFEPPEDAEVIEAEPLEGEEFQTIAEAEAAAPFDLPRPTVPEEYELLEVILPEPNNQPDAVMWYFDGTENAIFINISLTQPTPDHHGEQTQIGPIEGMLVESDEHRRFSWSCETPHYQVNGPVSEEELTMLVESIGCE